MEFTDFLSPHYDFYNTETKLYTNKRGAGLYAVLNWMVRAICLLERFKQALSWSQVGLGVGVLSYKRLVIISKVELSIELISLIDFFWLW